MVTRLLERSPDTMVSAFVLPESEEDDRKPLALQGLHLVSVCSNENHRLFGQIEYSTARRAHQLNVCTSRVFQRNRCDGCKIGDGGGSETLKVVMTRAR